MSQVHLLSNVSTVKLAPDEPERVAQSCSSSARQFEFPSETLILSSAVAVIATPVRSFRAICVVPKSGDKARASVPPPHVPYAKTVARNDVASRRL